MSTDLGNHTHSTHSKTSVTAPPSHPPLQQTQPERHVAPTSSRSRKRASQVFKARSPGSIPSSSTLFTYHNSPVVPFIYSSSSSSSEIPEYPLPPSYYYNPHAGFTEEFAPFVLYSGAEILTRHQDPEAGDQVAVVTPAAPSFNEYAANLPSDLTPAASSFNFNEDANYIDRFRTQNPGPLTERDLPSDPRLYKHYLCRVFSIQFTDVIDLTGHINRQRFIAAGGSGEVWEASWQGLDNNRLIGTPKALPMAVVKLVRIPPLRDEVQKAKRYKRMKRELLLWSKLNHPHILPLVGIARVEGDANLPAFVSPWMENGNIMEYLKQNPSLPASKFLKEMIKGLHYLHSFDPVIVHGDLKGANVLINHRKEACLCDFGLSRFVVDNTLWRTTATHATGTLRWMAPELIQEDITVATIATDIYAFGMTCYEILSRESPFAAVNDFAVMKKVTDGQRPAKIESCHSDEMWSIITRCWAHEPGDRPSTEETLKLVLRHDTPST
ncbi:hypothetical protein M378DRAFT_753083 [Amanita muscaria Koide BX008]|uniref:Protein kinase domain-containing protein n=1 Tax=Amanita muscaria (strain Koide BX008) TaxID=946122 RepID=A0A0C2WER2_AMAMK|nr:hypothetical protein M378DRAFT_753083 [Amanita muscaria Koide BX008]